MPILENTMANYMNCNQLLFGRKVKYGIAFTMQEKAFNIYRRKQYHNFRAPIIDGSHEGDFGIRLEKQFTVSRTDKVLIYN